MQTYFFQSIWNINSGLYLWIESQKPNNEMTVEGHLPSATNKEKLEEILKEAEIYFTEIEKISIKIPTLDNSALISSKVTNNTLNVEPKNAHYKEYLIDAAKLNPLDTISYLTSFSPSDALHTKADNTVIYWREVCKFILELLTKGHFLPGIKKDNGKYFSSWTFLSSLGDFDSKFQELKAAMPDACLSLTKNSLTNHNNKEELLINFINTIGEDLIRVFLKKFEDFNNVLELRDDTKTFISRLWFDSLSKDITSINASSFELSKLEQRLKSWASKYYQSELKYTPQTALRLSSPEQNETDKLWTLELGIRPVGEQDSFIPAKEIWQGNTSIKAFTEFEGDDLENFFLKDLAKGVKISPIIRKLLEDDFPTKTTLELDEAYSFLKNQVSNLEQLGLSVMVPSWWTKSRKQIGISVKIDSGQELNQNNISSALLGSSELLDFSWQAVIGGQEISKEDFLNMIAQNVPLQNINGEWIELDQKKISKTLDFLKSIENKKKISFFEALKIGIDSNDEDILPVVGLSASGWIKQILEGNDLTIELPEIPKDFNGTLRPYQKMGVAWLSSRLNIGIGSCLADDMGLGKTVQFLNFLLHQKAGREGERILPILLIVPMSILMNWEQEAKRFTPTLSVYLHHGSQRLSGKAFIEQAQNADIIITTYNLAYRDEDLFNKIEISGIVLDEAQNIKNIETKQSQAIRRLCQNNLNNQQLLPFKRLALTGTPLENHLEEIWSIFDFLNPGLLGTYNEFKTKFALPIEKFRDKDRAAALSKLLQPFILRRLKSDPQIISDLPEKIEMEVPIPLTPEQASLYQAALDEMLPQLEAATGIHRKGLVLSTITKLKQICIHPALFLKDGSSLEGRSHKITRLEQFLEEVVEQGDKVLIFTQFAQFGHLLQPYLQEKLNLEVLFFHGGLNKTKRDAVVQKFQEQSGPPVMILSLKAGGFGLNLTQANQIIHLDQWWNPAVEAQATDRAYRIGQKRNVQVRKLICQGTLEEKISAIQKNKLDLAQQIVLPSKQELTQLSTEDLKSLLELTNSLALQE